MVDIVPPQQQAAASAGEQAAPNQDVALSAEVRWNGAALQPPHIVGDTWRRVAAHAAEADDAKGARAHACMHACSLSIFKLHAMHIQLPATLR